MDKYFFLLLDFLSVDFEKVLDSIRLGIFKENFIKALFTLVRNLSSGFMYFTFELKVELYTCIIVIGVFFFQIQRRGRHGDHIASTNKRSNGPYRLPE